MLNVALQVRLSQTIHGSIHQVIVPAETVSYRALALV